MPFRLTNAGEYAVRLMVYLAGRAPGELTAARAIAQDQNIPQRFLRSIVSQFAKQGLIDSVQGNGGGVRLAEGAADKTLLEVIEAVEGPIYLNACIQGEEACQFSSHCAVHLVWHEAQDAIRNILGKRTIGELSGINLAQSRLLPATDQMCGVPDLESLAGGDHGN
ncbi:MAG: Rrf2 family transcriptional regulator [Candidatus Marinimicrobia bacterium]|nr:Rrf2 family transcriptional regulator [Candidatus Neomarinimicrobiota bacterium]MCF7903593.1 Rrf2 family transcriptional regulator [Candidatus Neomarinimicrobiota bacterium]